MNIRVGSHFKHLSSAYMKTRNCNECHTVPDTPFSGNHMATPRYNSQTLNFDQASSAKWSGVTLANVTYPFNGYTAGTAIKAATCSSIYCHGNRLKNSDPGGSDTIRKPYWNYSAMVNYSNPGQACGRCHGNPPGVVSDHSGVTATTGCVACHASTVDATGKIVNKALHINGIVEAIAGDCLTCHSVVTGSLPRRIITTELGSGSSYKSHHVLGIATSKFHCIICHAEGDSATGGTTTVHKNGSVDLRNVDTPSNPGTAGTNYWSIPNTKVGSDYTNVDNFCFRCHDAAGAAGIAMSSATTITTAPSGAQALNPFADTRTNSYDGVARTRVVDVDTQFTTTNYSHHAVKAPKYTSATAPAGGSLLFNTAAILHGGNVDDNSRLHCHDCHYYNGHGIANNEYMLQNSSGADTLHTEGTYVCMKCHTATHSTTAHTGGNGSDFVNGRSGNYNVTGISCTACHNSGGMMWGGIHGGNYTYSTGATPGWNTTGSTGSGQSTYRFMPGMANNGYFPSNWTTAANSPTCYTNPNASWSACSSHTGGITKTMTRPGGARNLSY